MSTERVIVQRDISSALISELTALAKKLKVGPTTGPNANPSANMAGLVSDVSAERIVGLVRDAEEAGAQVLVGDGKREGSYVQPHVVLGYKPGMRIWHEETFGPGMSLSSCCAFFLFFFFQLVSPLSYRCLFSLFLSFVLKIIRPSLKY